MELEGPADPARPPAEWAPSDARDTVVSVAGGRSLVELVVLRQIRRKRRYTREGSIVELSVDDVEVVSGDRIIDRFAELEAELIAGDERVLVPLAAYLGEIEELLPSRTSKLERSLEAVAAARAAEPDEIAEDEPDDEGIDDSDAGSAADAGLPIDHATVAEVLAPDVDADADDEEDGPADDELPDGEDTDLVPPDDDVLLPEADADPFALPAAPALDGSSAEPIGDAVETATADGAMTSQPAPERALTSYVPSLPATVEPAGTGAGAPRALSPTSQPAATPGAAAAPSGAAARPATPGSGPEPEPKPEPRLTAGKTPGVMTDDHLGEAGRKVLRFHLARMVAREAGTREGQEAEELHAMRVATRRQRAAWRVFGVAFDQKRTGRHQRRLKEVARDLGAVRDLDVLIEAGVAYQKQLPAADRVQFEPLLAKWRGQRDAARVVLIKELDSERYRRWLDEYIAFVQAEGIGTRSVGPVEPHRVRDTMPSRIWAAYEAVRAYEPVMRWADVTTLHDLRIAAKWLRYTVEFVREALGPESAPVIERVVALQDHLGWLHDADVAAGLARAFLVEHAGDLTEQQSAAIGRYLVDRERELARLRRTVGPVWRGVASLGFRRALGRLVAGL